MLTTANGRTNYADDLDYIIAYDHMGKSGPLVQSDVDPRINDLIDHYMVRPIFPLSLVSRDIAY